MVHRGRFLIWVLAIVCSHLIDAHCVRAQSIWSNRNHGSSISLEILKPSFAEDVQTTIATSTMFLSGKIAVSDAITLVGEIPFSHFGIKSSFGGNASESAVGNPYVGIEIHGADSPFLGEIGIRLPFSPKDNNQSALLSGLLTEFVDRAEAFVQKTLPISGVVNYHYKDSSGFILRLRGGVCTWVALGVQNETQAFLLYAPQVGLELSEVTLLAGVSGRLFLSEQGLSFGERAFHQFGFSTIVTLGIVQPGISLKVPLNKDMGEILNVVFGVSLGFLLD